jgi:hypothetical protein
MCNLLANEGSGGTPATARSAVQPHTGIAKRRGESGRATGIQGKEREYK